VARIVVTHFHPDHAGGGADAQALTGARVLQGAHDYEQCEAVWGSSDWSERLAEYLRAHGLRKRKPTSYETSRGSSRPSSASPATRSAWPKGTRSTAGRCSSCPARGRHICLLRDGILIAGSPAGKISPTVGLYPDSRPDPLGDYLASLERTVELAPSVALAGHNDPSPTRSRGPRDHRAPRRAPRRGGRRAGIRAPQRLRDSLALFGEGLDAGNRRFALAETIAHLERLVREGLVARTGDDSGVSYTAA